MMEEGRLMLEEGRFMLGGRFTFDGERFMME